MRGFDDRARLRRKQAWAEAHVLGGFAALVEAETVCVDAIERGRRLLRDLDERAALAAFWPRFEAEADESLLDALSLTVGQRDGEADGDYDRRLRALYADYRLRLEAPPPTARPSDYVADAPARPRSTDEGPPPVVVAHLRRSEVSALRRAFYRIHRRNPTPLELGEAARASGLVG